MPRAQYGVNLLRLPPGAWSSPWHWHAKEDEFVYVLSGEVVLADGVGKHVCLERNRFAVLTIDTEPPAMQHAIISSVGVFLEDHDPQYHGVTVNGITPDRLEVMDAVRCRRGLGFFAHCLQSTEGRQHHDRASSWVRQ
jgi:hypothetical protein